MCVTVEVAHISILEKESYIGIPRLGKLSNKINILVFHHTIVEY